MNSLPAEHRGAGGGMNQTFQNSAQVLSIGIFFTLMIVGLSATLPQTLSSGLVAHGVPAATATQVVASPAGLGPVRRVPRLQPGADAARPGRALAREPRQRGGVQGRSFFPNLIEDPFRTGLHEAFAFAIVACLVAAAASWLRGTPHRAESVTAEADEFAGVAD